MPDEERELKRKLRTTDHSRDSARLRYVYPVVSRRAGGVSVGVNLDTNDACNWRCIYCQVPGLTKGRAPPVDLALLEAELAGFLRELVSGTFLKDRVPEGMRRVNDVALSGNGEPTSAVELPEVVRIVAEQKRAAGLDVKTVLITNGSLVSREHVKRALAAMASDRGEVWFKLDRATREGIALVNQTALDPDRALARLTLAAALCPTWVQTCMFALDGAPPSGAEVEAYVAWMARAKATTAARGVLLYGLARPSLQPEAPRLSALPSAWMEALAERVRAVGLPVTVAV